MSAELASEPGTGTKLNAGTSVPFTYQRPAAGERSTETATCVQVPAGIVGPGTIWVDTPMPSSRKHCWPFRYSAQPSVRYGELLMCVRFSTIMRLGAALACGSTHVSIANGLAPKL